MKSNKNIVNELVKFFTVYFIINVDVPPEQRCYQVDQNKCTTLTSFSGYKNVQFPLRLTEEQMSHIRAVFYRYFPPFPHHGIITIVLRAMTRSRWRNCKQRDARLWIQNGKKVKRKYHEIPFYVIIIINESSSPWSCESISIPRHLPTHRPAVAREPSQGCILRLVLSWLGGLPIRGFALPIVSRSTPLIKTLPH